MGPFAARYLGRIPMDGAGDGDNVRALGLRSLHHLADILLAFGLYASQHVRGVCNFVIVDGLVALRAQKHKVLNGVPAVPRQLPVEPGAVFAVCVDMGYVRVVARCSIRASLEQRRGTYLAASGRLAPQRVPCCGWDSFAIAQSNLLNHLFVDIFVVFLDNTI